MPLNIISNALHMIFIFYNKYCRIIALLLISCIVVRADGQMIPLGDIVGIWALTFETADCEGSIIMDFNANHGVKITQTINIENAKNVAFRYCSGSWQIINNGNLKLKLDISDGRNFLQWTVENSMALGNDTNIDQVKAEALLLDISKNYLICQM